MWTQTPLKCPEDEPWLAVVRVTSDGDTELVAYLGHIPEDAEHDLDALQQRWIERWTWPGDPEVQEGARVREYAKYPDE